MSEPIDVYCDSFQLNTAPYGAALNFFLTGGVPPSPGIPPQTEKMATIRMSLEHLKVMTFIMVRQVKQYEEQAGVAIEIPRIVLNGLQIGKEDWDGLWRR